MIRLAEPVMITSPAIFPNACAGRPYTFTVQTSGGVPPLQFSFSSNAWIAINLDPATGTFSGTSAGVGTFTGTLGVLDSAQPISTQGQNVSLTVVNCP
ncbi:MAG: hypothetical protein GZ088_01715 [Acidipila sp.]|nr:hypothetical protein [Acidipila sp.]